MHYEFLDQFARRMKYVGRYAVLLRMSMNKQTWKQYGFEDSDEEINLLFSVLLYIMEQSLKDENCTVDDIAAFIDDLNTSYFRKAIGYDECRTLSDFIINVILSNEGQSMSFHGFDFTERQYRDLPVSFVNNKVVYTDGDVRRTSYYLTEDGYNLVLSTLEIEDNLKLTVHEMIFELHLKKQSYDKAVSDIRNVFQLLQIQLRKIQEAMVRIRRNALNYSVEEYQKILNENLDTISETKDKFTAYRRQVRERSREMEEMNLNVQRLTDKESKTLANLRQIDDYLSRALDEQQKILESHLDLKSLYTHELEQLSQMSMIRRFSLTADLYDKVLDDPSVLDRMDIFFRPLFRQNPEKIYLPDKSFAPQRPIRSRVAEEDEEWMDQEAEDNQAEERERIQEKLALYRKSVSALIGEAIHGHLEGLTDREGHKRFAASCSLQELAGKCSDDPDLQKAIIPDADKFKEIMVEFLKSRTFDIDELQKERKENLQEEARTFSLSEILLDLADEMKDHRLYQVEAMKIDDGSIAEFRGVPYGDDMNVDIRCSNCLIRVRWEDSNGYSKPE